MWRRGGGGGVLACIGCGLRDLCVDVSWLLSFFLSLSPLSLSHSHHWMSDRPAWLLCRTVADPGKKEGGGQCAVKSFIHQSNIAYIQWNIQSNQLSLRAPPPPPPTHTHTHPCFLFVRVAIFGVGGGGGGAVEWMGVSVLLKASWFPKKNLLKLWELCLLTSSPTPPHPNPSPPPTTPHVLITCKHYGKQTPPHTFVH